MTKTWFITGTSTGFGRELTEQLLARGDRVAATLRWPAVLDELANRYGASLWVRELDVTKTSRIREVIDAAFEELGRVDIVVSNAAYRLLGAAEELSDKHIARQIETNVVGSVQLARAVIPHLRAQRGGRIIQISGMCGQIGLPGLSLYTLTRWALEGFYESFGPEVAPFGVHTCLVEPGNSRNQFASHSSVEAPPRTSTLAHRPAWYVTRPGPKRRRTSPASWPRSRGPSSTPVTGTSCRKGCCSGPTPTGWYAPRWPAGWPQSKPRNKRPSPLTHKAMT